MSPPASPRRRSDRLHTLTRGDIELLAPDPEAFDSSATTFETTPDSARQFAHHHRIGSRRAAIAATGLVALVVIGAVVVTAPWSGDPADTAATSTAGPTPINASTITSSPLPAITTPDGARLRGVVLDPPPGWLLAGALSGPPVGNFVGWGEVWAQAGSTRERGAWYALSITPFDPEGIGLADAVRVRVDDRTALVERAADGVLTLTVEAPFERRDRLMRIATRGTTIDELARFASSIGIESDRLQLVDEWFVFRDPSFLEPMTKVWSGPTDWDPIRTAVVDDVRASTLYTDDAGGWLWLGLRDGPLPVTAMLEFERQLVADVGPSGASAALIGRSPHRSHLWFSFDEGYVSAISTLSEDELARVLPSVRRASEAEWALARRAEGKVVPPTVAALAPIASGSLESGTTWDVRAEPLGAGISAELRLGPAESTACCLFELFADADDPLGIASTLDVTLVVSRFPGPHTLRIDTAEGTFEQAVDGPTVVPVLAFGDLRVELLDPTEQVVGTE